MRRHLLALAVLGLFGTLLASDASACCHKRQACAPTACAAPAPAPCAPRKHCFSGLKLFQGGGLCHKRQACAPVTCAAPAPCGVAYPTVMPSGQATPQS